MRYIYRDEGCEFELDANSINDAKEKARNFLKSCPWDDLDSSIQASGWIEIIDEDENGNEVEIDTVDLSVTIDPNPPECESHDKWYNLRDMYVGEDNLMDRLGASEDQEDGHVWSNTWDLLGGIKENPGVQGFPGGGEAKSVCLRCGIVRKYTWNHNPQPRGIPEDSVSYISEDECDVEEYLETELGGFAIIVEGEVKEVFESLENAYEVYKNRYSQLSDVDIAGSDGTFYSYDKEVN